MVQGSGITAEDVRAALDYDPDTGVFTWRPRPPLTPRVRGWNTSHAGKPAGTIKKSRTREYVQICLNRKLHHAHRLAWLHHHGEWPANNIDHINGDGLDNRIANLRDVTQSQNCANAQISRNNAVGLKGVHWNKRRNRFTATIRVRRRSLFLGNYDSAEEAHRAYRRAAAEHFGDCARFA